MQTNIVKRIKSIAFKILKNAVINCTLYKRNMNLCIFVAVGPYKCSKVEAIGRILLQKFHCLVTNQRAQPGSHQASAAT